MRKIVVALVALLVSNAPAFADDDVGPVMEAVFNNMAVSYYCRDDIGSAHYTAARTVAKNVLTKYVGNKQAVLSVEQMDKKFRNDPRAKNPKTSTAKCYELKADAMHKIEVEQAKLSQ